jgi:hypothetical protein
MRRSVRNSVALVFGVALALAVFSPGSTKAATAKQAQRQSTGTFELSARKRHHHYRHDNGRAGLRIFRGVVGSAAAIAAAHEGRRQWGQYGIYSYYDGYEIQAPPAYYGFGSSYGPYYPQY